MKTPDRRRFTHEAMNTIFRLDLPGVENSVAAGMARECFDRLDFLESRLSRFIEGSDVSRINHLKTGETLRISEECHACLLAALEGHARTGGLFDVSLGRQIEHQKSSRSGQSPSPEGSLIIHPDTAAVTCQSPGREIDLGGIGKGYALDQLREILVDWGAPGGLICAGASSLLAFGEGSWPVDLPGGETGARIDLSAQALSASGTGIQGNHIVHPGGEMPANPPTRIWVAATTATVAEIWSTALMLVETVEIASLTSREAEISEIYFQHERKNGELFCVTKD
ncbi:MAG: FAD:protein FMN transferase [Luteolibacter sp.]